MTSMRAACATHVALFQDPALEEPTAAATGTRAQLHARARSICAGCPLVRNCLYDAVVRHDVAGFVAGTTARDRRAIRTALRVSVASENLDAIAGVAAGGSHRVDREEVIRLRRANPDETLEQLARRLGCSMSTVKRHLRTSRREGGAQEAASKAPTVDAVWDAAQSVLGPRVRNLAA